jgi:hypothetical protein
MLSLVSGTALESDPPQEASGVSVAFLVRTYNGDFREWLHHSDVI